MLVLSRQKDESIEIGGPATLDRLLTREEHAALRVAGVQPGPLGEAIRKAVNLLDTPVLVTTVDIRRDKVRLGFSGSKEVPIWREEINANNTQLHRPDGASVQPAGGGPAGGEPGRQAGVAVPL